LNQVSVLINREGVFYGQCSEICGVLHSSMPIVIESVSLEKFLSWLDAQSSSLAPSRQHVSLLCIYVYGIRNHTKSDSSIKVLGSLTSPINFSTVRSLCEELTNTKTRIKKCNLGISNGSKNARLGFKQSLEKSKYF